MTNYKLRIQFVRAIIEPKRPISSPTYLFLYIFGQSSGLSACSSLASACKTSAKKEFRMSLHSFLPCFARLRTSAIYRFNPYRAHSNKSVKSKTKTKIETFSLMICSRLQSVFAPLSVLFPLVICNS